MNWSHIPSLASLRAFYAAAQHGNFSAAARELNVTHAAIAQHVRSLEADFALPLMVREGRGVALTPAGADLADKLKVGFEHIWDGVAQTRQVGKDSPISITLTPSFAEKWLMPRLADFWAKHPEVCVNLNPSLDVMDLATQSFDLGIRYGSGTWQGLEAEPLTDGDFWVVAHPDLIAGRQVTCLDDVTDLPWVLESHMLSGQGLLEQQGIDLDKVAITSLSTTGLVQSAVAAGMGLTVQSRPIVEALVERGELVRVCTLHQPGYGYYLVTRPNRPKSAGLKAFIAWLLSFEELCRQ